MLKVKEIVISASSRQTRALFHRLVIIMITNSIYTQSRVVHLDILIPIATQVGCQSLDYELTQMLVYYMLKVGPLYTRVKFHASFIHGAGNAVYSGVGGGCMLTSLINFSDRQDISALRSMSQEKVKRMSFYNTMFDHWYWTRNLEEHVERRKGIKPQSAATLEMTGVSSVVCGHEMPQKPDKGYNTEYQDRANSPYGYHPKRVHGLVSR